jgi:hypothetical protein
VTKFRAPIRAENSGFVIDIDDDETALVQRLTAELRSLLLDPDPSIAAEALLARLFPVAYPDDAEREDEYQRLMREELVASKLSALQIVDDALREGGEIDEPGLVAFMQSINSVRLVLGTMLKVTDDPDADEVSEGLDDSPEYNLYAYLSWLLEWTVRAMTGDTSDDDLESEFD